MRVSKRQVAKGILGLGIFIGVEVIVSGIIKAACPNVKPIVKPCVWLAELAIAGAVADQVTNYNWNEFIDPTIDQFQAIINGESDIFYPPQEEGEDDDVE